MISKYDVIIFGTDMKLSDRSPVPIPKLIRPIFDWSEVSEYFKPTTPQVDYTFLTQVIHFK